MKKVALILGAGIFFVLLLVLLFLKLFPRNSQTLPVTDTVDPFKAALQQAKSIYTDTADHTAVTCYTWYVHAFAQGANAPTISSRPEASKCFTGEFISNWQAIIESTGSDPVVLSQDYAMSWLQNIEATTIGQSVNSTDELVQLGSGDETHIVIAHIIRKQSGEWLIDSVSAQEHPTVGTP